MRDIRLNIGCHNIRIDENDISIVEVGEGYSISIDMTNEQFEELLKAYCKFHKIKSPLDCEEKKA